MCAVGNQEYRQFSICPIQKISAQRGGKRAVVAVAHSMLLAIYAILKNKESFRDLSSNYYNEINHDKILNRNIQSQRLGFSVTLEKIA